MVIKVSIILHIIFQGSVLQNVKTVLYYILCCPAVCLSRSVSESEIKIKYSNIEKHHIEKNLLRRYFIVPYSLVKLNFLGCYGSSLDIPGLQFSYVNKDAYQLTESIFSSPCPGLIQEKEENFRIISVTDFVKYDA